MLISDTRPEPLRFFLDTEFNDEVGNCLLEPISVGIVSEYGRNEFYAESSEFNERAANAHPFLPEHVLPKLGPKRDRVPVIKIRDGIKTCFKAAAQAEPGADKAEIWSRDGGMDQATLAMIFGGLSNFYAFMNSIGLRRSHFNDTTTLRRQLNEPFKLVRLPDCPPHHALYDARHERREYLGLMDALAAERIQRAAESMLRIS